VRVPSRSIAAIVALALLITAAPAGAGLGAAAATDSPLCLARTRAAGAGITAAVESPAPDPVAHPRLHRWALTSTAMSGAAMTVNVLLPADYATSGLSYKVLYLLHGHGGGADDWWKEADANGTSLEAIVDKATEPLIVVMPDGGYDGWYSDWYGVDVDGHSGTDPNAAPAWETFHTGELVPWIDAEYRTLGGRSGHVIAGLSMGGYGAMIYAARHADLFAAAGSFSGAVDTMLFDPLEPLVQPVAANAADRRPPDNCVWGDAVTQHDRWVEHNPAEQVAGLDGVPLYASSGDGCLPSTANPDPNAPAACQQAGLLSPAKAGAAFTEWGVRQQNQSFHDKVAAECANNPCATRTYDFYSPGLHEWRWWLGELGTFVAWLHTDAAAL